MNTSQKYKVSILGQTYTLVSDESEGTLLSAAKKVDTLMKDLVPQGAEVDVTKVAVLTALQLALQTLQLEQQVAEQTASHMRLMNLLASADTF